MDAPPSLQLLLVRYELCHEMRMQCVGASQDQVLGSSWGSSAGAGPMSSGGKADSGSRKHEDQPGSASARQPSGGSRRRRHRVPSSGPVSRIFLSEHTPSPWLAERWYNAVHTYPG